MSTFLSLCADVTRESGGAGRAPVSVVGQSGRQDKIVQWVKQAWVLIQNEREDWPFLKGEWQGQLTIGSTTYTGASFNADRFAAFVGDRPCYRPTTIYDPDIGQADESELRQIPWESFKVSYDRGVQVAQRPIVYAFDPAGAIRFPKPDKPYWVRGEYRKAPQVLAADGDIPDLPARFHQRIVWRAIMLMSGHDEAVNALTIAATKDTEMRRDMVNDLLPDLDLRAGGPLA